MKKLNITFSAIVAVVLASMMSIAPATATATEAAWDTCIGSDVKRCVDVALSGGEIVVSGGRVDDGGPTDHWVAVSNLRIQHSTYGVWNTIAEDTDYDNWHESYDVANISTINCQDGDYRAVATFKWKRKGSSTVYSDVIATPSQYFNCQ